MRTTRRFIRSRSLLGREQYRAMLESGMGIGCTCREGDVGRCACGWMSDARRWRGGVRGREATTWRVTPGRAECWRRGRRMRKRGDAYSFSWGTTRGGGEQEKGDGMTAKVGSYMCEHCNTSSLGGRACDRWHYQSVALLQITITIPLLPVPPSSRSAAEEPPSRPAP